MTDISSACRGFSRAYAHAADLRMYRYIPSTLVCGNGSGAWLLGANHRRLARAHRAGGNGALCPCSRLRTNCCSGSRLGSHGGRVRGKGERRGRADASLMLVWCPSRSSIGHDASANNSVAFGSTEKESSIWHHAPKICPFRSVFPIWTSMRFARASKSLPKKNRDFLRAVVDGATAGVAEFLTQQRSQPHRRNDRKLVASAISALKKVRQHWIDLGLKGRKPSANLRTFLVRWCPLDGCTSSFQTIASLQR